MSCFSMDWRRSRATVPVIKWGNARLKRKFICFALNRAVRGSDCLGSQGQDICAKVVFRYVRPIDHYRGEPASLHEQRRRKMAVARHRRREKNLKLRQATLPLQSPEGVANQRIEMPHCGGNSPPTLIQGQYKLHNRLQLVGRKMCRCGTRHRRFSGWWKVIGDLLV